MLESIQRIEDYVKGVTRDEFFEDFQLQDAVIRRLEVIGEAARQLSADLKARHHNIPWAHVIGMRNILIHEYFGVDLGLVWATVHKDLPVLRDAVLEILNYFW
ncbi:MAG: DUF86 domain-containing protein [Thermoanaerobacteraceae bacterium]|nr:DUF86 domain-containing protein [Thermoanaerobacteraceae bacterium]